MKFPCKIVFFTYREGLAGEKKNEKNSSRKFSTFFLSADSNLSHSPVVIGKFDNINFVFDWITKLIIFGLFSFYCEVFNVRLDSSLPIFRLSTLQHESKNRDYFCQIGILVAQIIRVRKFILFNRYSPTFPHFPSCFHVSIFQCFSGNFHRIERMTMWEKWKRASE